MHALLSFHYFWVWRALVLHWEPCHCHQDSHETFSKLASQLQHWCAITMKWTKGYDDRRHNYKLVAMVLDSRTHWTNVWVHYMGDIFNNWFFFLHLGKNHLLITNIGNFFIYVNGQVVHPPYNFKWRSRVGVHDFFTDNPEKVKFYIPHTISGSCNRLRATVIDYTVSKSCRGTNSLVMDYNNGVIDYQCLKDVE